MGSWPQNRVCRVDCFAPGQVELGIYGRTSCRWTCVRSFSEMNTHQAKTQMPPSIRRHKSRRTFGCDTCLATSSVVSRSKHLAVRWQVASGLATTFLMLSSTSRAHCGCKTSFGTPRSRKLAQAGCDTFTLSRIAGHSSTTLTRRYIHPQRTPLSAHFARISFTVKASRIGGGRSGRGSGGHKIGPGGMAKNRETLQVWCERGDSNPHGFTR